MKNTILLLASVVLSTQAFATATSILPTQTIEPSKGTKALEVRLQTISAVNCPGEMSLKAEYEQGLYNIKSETTIESEILNAFTQTLSEACQNEVIKQRFEAPPVNTCLSIGFEGGSVYIPVYSENPIKLQFPINLKIEEVVELK